MEERKDIKDGEGVEIFLGYACDVKCVFCYQKDFRRQYPRPFSTERVEEALRAGRHGERHFAIFSGGEPTVDPRLPRFVSLAKSLGYRHVRVHTNGRGFADPAYLADLVARGLTGVTVSVHGVGPTHDEVVRSPGAFARIAAALDNLSAVAGDGFSLDTNSVICRGNFARLPMLAAFLARYPVTRAMMVLAYSLELFSAQEKRLVVPEYREFVPPLEKAVAVAWAAGLNVVVENVPYCMVRPPFRRAIDNNIRTKKDSLSLAGGEQDDKELFNYWRAKVDACASCRFDSKCRGFSRDYVETYGNDFAAPVA